MQFTPTEDFFSEEMRSQYMKGLTYTVRPGDDALEKCVQKWMKDGKVSEGAAPVNATGPAKVSGKGKVK
jgi:hypothetical protein